MVLKPPNIHSRKLIELNQWENLLWLERKRLILILKYYATGCFKLPDNCDVSIDELFEYELSVNPTALFTENGLLRSADDKTKLTDCIADACKPDSTPEDKDNLQIERSVIDMGSLLQTKVMWRKGDTYGKIIEDYIIIAQSDSHCVPVFDGYRLQ